MTALLAALAIRTGIPASTWLTEDDDILTAALNLVTEEDNDG